MPSEGLAAVDPPESPPAGSQSDLTVALSGLARGDVASLHQVWALCADDLYGLALWATGSRADAEDAVQDVFLRLARKPDGAAQARNPRAYLLTMAHRAAVDQRRKRRESPLEPQMLLVAPPHDVAGSADAERASRLLHELPAPQREVVFLKHFAEMTFREIGRVTGVPTFTAAARYRLALRRLRRQMGITP
jgi:RNA polymerase sigma-70 factor (ECF subfamily)